MHTGERGYTLMEVLIAVGMIAVLAVGGLGVALSMKPQELSAATMQFDAIVSSARSVASAFDGATIFVSTANDGTQNFHAQVYGHRPNGARPVVPAAVPPLVARAAITETNEVHDPAFAIIIHSSGAIGARANFGPTDTPSGPELGCPPAQNAFAFVFTVNGHTATRFLPCHLDLASTAPPTFASPPPGPATPTPIAFPNQTFPTPPAPTASPCVVPNTLFQDECASPLTTNIAELHFYNPTDPSPDIYDTSLGTKLGTDPGGSVHISETNYTATYGIDSADCNTMFALPTAVRNPSGGADFQITPFVNPPIGFHNCTLNFHDENSQSLHVNVQIAGPLTLVDDATQQAPAGGAILINANSSAQWETKTLDTRKVNFASAIVVGHSGTCDKNVSLTTITSTLQLGFSQTQVALTGIATTFDSQGNSNPCTLIIVDQFPSATAPLNPFPDLVTLSIVVGPLLPPPPPPGPWDGFIGVIHAVGHNADTCTAFGKDSDSPPCAVSHPGTAVDRTTQEFATPTADPLIWNFCQPQIGEVIGAADFSGGAPSDIDTEWIQGPNDPPGAITLACPTSPLSNNRHRDNLRRGTPPQSLRETARSY